MMFGMIPFDRRDDNLFDLFDNFEKKFFGNTNASLPAFRTDIRDAGEHFILECELPGFRKEDISLTVKEDVLTVAAHREKEQQAGQYVCRERRAGDVRRSFDVSAIEQEGIRAAFENGVLVLTLPKASAVKPERRSISIQ